MSGERQVAQSVSGIRRDHVARYEWAAGRFGGKNIMDAGCGVGYGSKILARGGSAVIGVDASESAIQFARQHFNHDDRVQYQTGDVAKIEGQAEVVVAFEVLEHLMKPELALRSWRAMAGRLVVSVPNEAAFPYRPEYVHHVRHYTRAELVVLLEANGWAVREWWGQEGPESEMEPDLEGRTLVAICERSDAEPATLPVITAEDFALPGRPLPSRVAIIAMGGSYRNGIGQSITAGGHRAWLPDGEVWTVNQMGGVIQHDRLFHMDDLRIQQKRAAFEAENGLMSGVVGMMGWLPSYPGPLYTSRAYADFPGSVEYPLEWVGNQTGHAYFNNTVPYAIAFAIALGVKQVHLAGVDYTYSDPRMAAKRERGRACVEYWISVAIAKQIQVTIAQESTLLDMNEMRPGVQYYGYDAEWVHGRFTAEGFSVSRVARREEDVPDGKEMHLRYSHDPRIEALAKKKEG